jgi:hypothetical protein
LKSQSANGWPMQQYPRRRLLRIHPAWAAVPPVC